MARCTVMSQSTQPHSHFFTVRVWIEKLGDGRTEQRGTVQHVLSGETRHFRDWEQLITFITEQMHLPPRANLQSDM